MRRQRSNRPQNNRRAPRRTPSHNRVVKGRVVGVVVGLIGVAIVAAVLVGTMHVMSNKVALDPDSGCPADGPPSEVTAIVIDGSDVLTPVQISSIRNEVEGYRDKVKKYGALELYLVGKTEAAVLRPIFKACNPGNPNEVSEFTASVSRERRKWQEGFINPLDAALSDAIPSTEQPTSPIMETIQSVVVTAFGLSSRKGIPKRLVIVSDMMQNTNAFSNYKSIDYEMFKQKAAKQLLVDLRHVVVEILYVRRKSVTKSQGVKHVQFWEQYFVDQGAEISRVYSISG